MKVAGFKPPSDNTEKIMLPYCSEWSLKATMEMIDLLQTNVRASVAVRIARFTWPLIPWRPFFTAFLPRSGV